MSVLSNSDFNREFGKNILIYPFIESNIKGASINLTVSKFVWNINTKERIFPQLTSTGKKMIIIPQNIPVAVMTREAIFVSNNICGTYHARVSKVSQGLNHISTTLDPGYFGTSLVTLLNNSDKPIEISVGDAFVTVMFYYLKNNSLKTTDRGQNMSNRIDIIAQVANDLSDYIKYTRKNAYLASKDDLEQAMEKDKKFNRWKESLHEKDKKLQKAIRLKKVFFHFSVASVMGLLAYGFLKIAFFYLEKNFNIDKDKLLIEVFVISFTLLCYGLRILYSNIYKKWFKKSLEKKVTEEVERISAVSVPLK